ncbi:MAG: multicopper oxidase domain-containing protein [Thermodesulfobacteriota bacterium]
MNMHKPLIMGLAVTVALLCGGVAQGLAQKGNPAAPGQQKKITQADRQAAAARSLQKGAINPLMVDAQPAAMMMPGQAPHYFSHPNYANSPLPMVEGAVIPVGNPLVDRQYASDFPVAAGELAPVFTVVPTALPDGMLQSFQVWNQASPGGSPFPSAGNVFHAYVLRPTGVPGEYTVVFDSGLLTLPALADPAISEIATFGVANLAVQAGDVLAFYGQGIPVDTGVGSDVLAYPAPTPPLQDSTITLGNAEYPIFPQARTYSFGAQVLDLSGQNTVTVGGIRKFIDGLPGLGVPNNLGQQIPVAVPDTTTYPGSDYYIIELGQYTEQMHSDLPPTTLRGYRQAGGDFHYLGPAIVAQKDRPVRILFRNLLPTGEGGNLFIPVDATVMGSGMTADGHAWMEANPDMVDPQNPMCSGPDKAMMVAQGLCYADNRATLHLHGGISPWISDGTPHQWITPAGENTAYPQGVSVQPVPDMSDSGDPNDGEMTFFYTNQQSARLMFYHDHAWGITRLNVYAGEAAPYIIQDATEQALVDQGIIPGPADTIPLVIQDKTFVPSDAQLMMQDETWDTARWGGEGSLWVPHVYSPAQNPGDASGINEFGRWAYGPWFWPPTNNVEHGPMPNPYFDPTCNPDMQWCEPPLMPGVPYLSMGMESFNDTPVVNGTAYPTITVEPKTYRFRILNAANDRFFNLSLYQAVDANGILCDAANSNPAPEATGAACTEVFLNPTEVAAALTDGTIFPTPVAGTEGPDWIAIGTEGGFLPSPVVIPAHPTTWVNDPTVFNAGNVDQHSLLTAPAERHDVIVDFSAFAGQTLILYNDAPAAFPARDPRYDYYTGNGDYRDTGGAPSTLPGYGPNTRTIMQIKVAAAAPAPAFNLAALENAFKATSTGGLGVFENGQHPIIVGQSEYNQALGTSFTGSEGLVQIYDTSLNFRNEAGVPLSMNLKPKMIQDEMGEAFELSYGRMSGFLGVETPNAQAGLQNMILHPYTYPPDEILDGIELPPGVELAPLATADDGTQIWKITHNGVDTHPIHFHLYDVQLLNRVGWDGIIRKPDANELGWKDTVRVSPLEDTIVALRPLVPHLPPDWSGLPNSIRLLDPSMPEGMYLEGANTTQREAMGLPLLAFNPDGEPVDIVNHFVNFGWEYVYHCHILSHEEMDMMHAQVVGVAPAEPTFVSAVASGNGNNRIYTVTWVDNSKNETAFVIQRSSSPNGPWSILATVPSDRLTVGPGTGTRTYTDRTRNTYYYQVYAINVVGDIWDYSNPAFNNILPGGGWPTLTLTSLPDAQQPAPTLAPPANLAASAAVKNKKTATVTLTWADPASNNETGFLIQRAYNAAFTSGVMNATVGPNVTSFTQDVVRGTIFYYRAHAFNDTTQSTWSNTTTITTP